VTGVGKGGRRKARMEDRGWRIARGEVLCDRKSIEIGNFREFSGMVVAGVTKRRRYEEDTEGVRTPNGR
jgi:hypothetical protein